MKILILDNFFYTSKFLRMTISKELDRFFLYYNRIKIKNIISRLIKENKGEVYVKVITDSYRKFFINNNVEVELLSDFRINLDHEEYIFIKKKVLENTRRNLISFFNNLSQIKSFLINGISIGKLIEIYLGDLLKGVFNSYELLKKNSSSSKIR